MAEPQHSLPDDRDETPTERMDRNWSELLQELRVTQTGTQILTGFLFTIPFQQRFGDLDDFQRTVYLTLVVLAVVATALIVAPVSVHRILFRKHLKPLLVQGGDLLARAGLVALALVLSGCTLLLFDVVVSRTAGVVAGSAIGAVLLVAWWIGPVVAERRALRSTA